MSKTAQSKRKLDRLLTRLGVGVPALSMGVSAWLLASHIGWNMAEVSLAALIWAGCGALIGRSVLVAVARRDAKTVRLGQTLTAEPVAEEEVNPVHQAFAELEAAVRETPVLKAAASASFDIAPMDETDEALLLSDVIELDVLELVEALERPATPRTPDNRVVQLFGGDPRPAVPAQGQSGEPARVALADALADIRKSLQA